MLHGLIVPWAGPGGGPGTGRGGGGAPAYPAAPGRRAAAWCRPGTVVCPREVVHSVDALGLGLGVLLPFGGLVARGGLISFRLLVTLSSYYAREKSGTRQERE